MVVDDLCYTVVRKYNECLACFKVLGGAFECPSERASVQFVNVVDRLIVMRIVIIAMSELLLWPHSCSVQELLRNSLTAQRMIQLDSFEAVSTMADIVTTNRIIHNRTATTIKLAVACLSVCK